jgi:hypothetical protein
MNYYLNYIKSKRVDREYCEVCLHGESGNSEYDIRR